VNLGLENRVALVCGSSRGLGRAVADELAAEGASVALCARDAGDLARARAEIEAATGATVFTVAADLAVTGEPTRVAEESLAHFGRLDILISNSGGPVAGSFATLARGDWSNATALLLMSAVELFTAVLPEMRGRRWGRILAITSIAAREPVDNLMLSNSLRPAVAGLAHALAREVAADGITVNTILPGFTNTARLRELHVSSTPGAVQAAGVGGSFLDAIPLGRLADPAEFAALAAFLVSERASYITGASFAVDGGWLRGL